MPRTAQRPTSKKSHPKLKSTAPATLGRKIDEVVLEIDYNIIEHFSKHLYGSPNRAIEELVSNGFDAFAKEVRVYVPGPLTPSHVVVWDDGDSMDAGGLKGLWHIASSPKLDVGRIARGPGGSLRQMIGKFGIGKLASYSVGRTISHLCLHAGQYLLVSVNYGTITGAGVPRGKSRIGRVRRPILELSKREAEAFVRRHFSNQPTLLDALLAKPSWTFAVIGELKEPERSGDLSPGMLSWILGNGMPLRPDFRVFVNEQEVVSKLARDGALDIWTFDHADIQKALSKEWKDALKTKDVSGQIAFGREVGLDPARPGVEVPYVEFPRLGKVYGEVRLYENSLETGRSADQGRSSGFFVMVRGRLVNPDNDKLFLHEPSFGTFYRAQYVLHVDGLDEDLLADRERLREGTPRAEEMKVLQQALYLVTRTAQTVRDEEQAKSESTGNRLPTQSREHFREPLMAFLVRAHPELASKFNFADPSVSHGPLGAEGPMADLSDDGGGFVINVQHPYFRSIETAFGHGRLAKEFMRRYELIAIAERLLEGQLYELGIKDDYVREIVRWRDGLFRTLAKSSHHSLYQLADELERTSYTGGKPFEKAITAMLRFMGFNTQDDGASGEKDGLLEAPCGPLTYTISIEAKGCNGPLPNDAAEVSGAAAHRKATGAEHAIIVARNFAGFGRVQGSEPAILKECRATGNVSIIETAHLGELASAIKRYGYPLDAVKPVFVEIESPLDKSDRIRQLTKPSPGFDWRPFLEAVWSRQSGLAKGDVVPYRAIKQEKLAWKALPDETFNLNMLMLQGLAPGLVNVNVTKEHIHLRQAPDIIIETIVATLDTERE